MSTMIKFCGCTSWEDVELAIAAGADSFGMIFASSPRRIEDAAAEHIAGLLPPSIVPVGVFVDPSHDEIARVRALFPNLVVQFSGAEDPQFVAQTDGTTMKAIHVNPDSPDAASLARAADAYPNAIAMFDTSVEGKAGGSGVAFPWGAVAAIAAERPVIVAGGLTPENVAACVRAVRPFGVDVRSGIETGGRKDVEKMRAFVRNVRDADAT